MGPFFIVYINDVLNIANSAELTTHADDMSILLSGSNADGLVQFDNIILRYLNIWVDSNQLIANTQRAKVVSSVH